MADNKHILQIVAPQAECLSQTEIDAYLLGNANAHTLRRVELHIAECELCADALEGYQLHKANRKLKIISRAKWIAFAAAASVAIFLILNIFVKQTPPTDIAMSEKTEEIVTNKPTEYQDIVEELNETSYQKKETKKDMVQNDKNSLESTSNSGATRTVVVGDELLVDETEDMVVQNDYISVIDADFNLSNKRKKESIAKDSENKGLAVENEYDDNLLEVDDSRSIENLHEFLPPTFRAISQEALMDSALIFRQDSGQINQNSEKLFVSAYMFHQSKKYTEALNAYTKIIDQKKEFTDEAHYLKALVLMEQKNTKEAKQLLRKIAASNSKYKTNAEQKLKELR